MDDLISPRSHSTDVKRLCRYKELNVLTIKRIDEQLSRLPPASVVTGDWLSTNVKIEMRIPNPLILISDQSHRAAPLSISICLVDPQYTS